MASREFLYDEKQVIDELRTRIQNEGLDIFLPQSITREGYNKAKKVLQIALDMDDDELFNLMTLPVFEEKPDVQQIRYQMNGSVSSAGHIAMAFQRAHFFSTRILGFVFTHECFWTHRTLKLTRDQGRKWEEYMIYLKHRYTYPSLFRLRLNVMGLFLHENEIQYDMIPWDAKK